MDAVVRMESVAKGYRVGRCDVSVLRGIELNVERGEWLALVGASGSGKSTLMHIAGTLERPDAGEVLIDGVRVSSMGDLAAARLRRSKIGFVFQSYHLLPELTILENVMLPGILDARPWEDSRRKAAWLLDRVGLSQRAAHLPGELSGGERQRVAIARALVNGPTLLLADEPTGNLDSATGAEILDLLKSLRNTTVGETIVMVTHDMDVAGLADRIATIKDGVIA